MLIALFMSVFAEYENGVPLGDCTKSWSEVIAADGMNTFNPELRTLLSRSLAHVTDFQNTFGEAPTDDASIAKLSVNVLLLNDLVEKFQDGLHVKGADKAAVFAARAIKEAQALVATGDDHAPVNGQIPEDVLMGDAEPLPEDVAIDPNSTWLAAYLGTIQKVIVAAETEGAVKHASLNSWYVEREVTKDDLILQSLILENADGAYIQQLWTVHGATPYGKKIVAPIQTAIQAFEAEKGKENVLYVTKGHTVEQYGSRRNVQGKSTNEAAINAHAANCAAEFHLGLAFDHCVVSGATQAPSDKPIYMIAEATAGVGFGDYNMANAFEIVKQKAAGSNVILVSMKQLFTTEELEAMYASMAG